MSNTNYCRFPTLLVVGPLIFLANFGLLALQLVAPKMLSAFIGSSVETWTCVIGVFLTGIALGNWIGGTIADRFPTPRTIVVILMLSGLSAFGMIAMYDLTLTTGFYKSIPLSVRIPLLALMFCLIPALLMSLLTPLTIKLTLPNIGNAGRLAGAIFALSTLGCLAGDYITGFVLLADFKLNTIATGVGIVLILLSLPIFFMHIDSEAAVTAPVSTAPLSPTAEPTDGGWNFRNNRKLAYLIVFLASFCGMSLELVGARFLAPTLGVSLFTWTGIIGVMLAGTASGNYLGGILADRGVGPTLRRFGILAGALLGAALGPMTAQHLFTDFNLEKQEWIEYTTRFVGVILGVLAVLPALWVSKRPRGAWIITAIIGGLIGTVIAHTVLRAIDRATSNEFFVKLNQDPRGALYIHALGFLVGAGIALLFAFDAPKKGEGVTRSSALSGSLFGAGLAALAVLVLRGIYDQYIFMTDPGDIVDKVMIWTFGLFFLPMLALGMISPQVIRLSITDVQSAGRTAGSIYAWSTLGAIVGTFATGYFLISTLGTIRVLMILALVLTGLAFIIGKLWKNNAMLYAASIVCGGAIFGLLIIGYGKNRYDLETKYYAIKVTPLSELDRRKFRLAEGERPRAVTLTLDQLTHSYVDPDDPTWLGYEHEYVQGELLKQVRARGGKTNLLVIGGGGYTFPRYVEHLMPDVKTEVVEIDPGVTEIAHRELGLSRDTKIRSYNMDGRQYIAELAPKGRYQLVMQDAVNDLSVPGHLMTKEYNNAVKAVLTPDGAYLLTLIDDLPTGKLWRAAVNTMRETFKYVYLIGFKSFHDRKGKLSDSRSIYIVYGADQPLDMAGLLYTLIAERMKSMEMVPFDLLQTPIGIGVPILWDFMLDRYTQVLEPALLEELLVQQKKIILTDQFCPVDNLMAEVFRERAKR